MLKVVKIETYHGRIKVLNSVSLDVEKGEIVTIIGANGAGKTTLLSTIAGIHRPKSGQVYLGTVQTSCMPVQDVVKAGISLVPEHREVFDSLSIIDNLKLGAYHRYKTDKKLINDDIENIFSLFPALRGRETQLAGTLSGGEQQMLAIGRGLMAKPKVLLLDEPSLGLAPLVVKEIFDILVSLKKRGTTILMVEQNAKAALKVADRAYIIERGQISLAGRARDMLQDTRVQSAYLGARLHA
ncbi:ABC transporter ATP-binding protein [Phosphitispora fastidiosa]|uniref:ABC transporter ATP-binding protein n=1 Tax=Phosphitispora fastidiosa TaxID=2837202 RepID=UPI001E4EF068|nr:ABC transporter ATP-binding protein [Phosphitispora fastidiosa]MBU7006810.1 branched-chain amino acid transport system ATP-binding protein [Phosphitispora fastidiosa]